MIKEPRKRYSQAFKLRVVKEYEAGHSEHYLRQKYGIGGSHTIREWVKTHGREGYRTEVIHIQTKEDQLEFQQMKQRIADLESALAATVVEKEILRKTVDVLERERGPVKKKSAT